MVARVRVPAAIWPTFGASSGLGDGGFCQALHKRYASIFIIN